MENNIFRPKAVIFDMDGTLFDTENLTIPMWEIAGKTYGYDITREIVLKMIGISAAKSRLILLEKFGEDFPFEKISDYFRELYKEEREKNGIPKKAGVDFLLERLTAAKIPYGLATSSRRKTALYNLEKAGILDKFASITGGDEVKNGKPAPDIFLLAAEKLNTHPSACVGFEDSTAGLEALSAAGIKSVFVKDVIDPPPEVLAKVWREYGNLAEAAELFV